MILTGPASGAVASAGASTAGFVAVVRSCGGCVNVRAALAVIPSNVAVVAMRASARGSRTIHACSCSAN
jgi:hypothetical protein